MNTVLSSLIHAIIASTLAVVLYRLLNNWGLDFQSPIVRAPERRSGIVIAIPSVLAIFVYYILVGFLVFYGLAKPLVPGTSLKINPLDLSIIALMMVGLVRILTLLSSVTTYRTLLNALVLSCALVSYMAFQDPDSVSSIIKVAAKANLTGSQTLMPTLVLPLIAIAIAATAELIWWMSVKSKDSLRVSTNFVLSMQEIGQKEEIGYTRESIHTAYKKAIKDVTSSEGIWEICWVSSRGARNKEFYDDLIEETAARIAIEKRELDSYSNFNILHPDNRRNYLDMAKAQLELCGMYLIHQASHEGIELFYEAMGFYPGLLSEAPNIRFMIINRRILITSWSAHDLRYAFGSKVDFRSTMYSRSEDPNRINSYLKQFQSLWGQYLMTNIGPVLASLSRNSPKVLDVIIDRAGLWTAEELLQVCNSRGINCQLSDIRQAIDELVQKKMVIKHNPNRISRNRNLFIWQDRWLRIRYQDEH